MNAIVGYNADGSPITADFFFTQGVGGGSAPPASLGEDMFRQPADATHPGLGMEKQDFFTARVFNGEIAHASNGLSTCGVGFLPGK
jgi:hypothetical protein